MGTKAFNKDMTCRGKQYAENTVFQEPDADLCRAGIHYCDSPFDVLKFYDLIDSECNFIVTAKVEPLGTVKTDGTKSVTDKIRIGEKQAFADFIQSGIEYIKEHTKVDADGANSDGGVNFARIGSSGYGARIGSSGYGARIGSSGDGAQIGSSGDGAQIGSSGYGARIGSSGDGAQIGSSGDGAQIGSSGDGAQIGSSGDGARIGSSGDGAQIGSSGDGARIGSSGENCVICCAGHNCRVKAKKGSWITLAEWKYDEDADKWVPACVKTEFVDGERIKADTPYMLRNGVFVEVPE